MQANDAQELKTLLIRTLQAMKERVPDWYGQALRALADVSDAAEIRELEKIAYQDQFEDLSPPSDALH